MDQKHSRRLWHRTRSTPSRRSPLARAASWLRGRASDDGGAVLVLVTLGMVSFIGFAALTLDVGRYLELRRQLQNAADAAAHAGAQELPDTAAAEAKALEYWDLNVPDFGDAQITISFPDPGGTGTLGRVRLDVEADTNVFLMQLFNVDRLGASVVAEAGAQFKDIVVVLDRSGSMCSDSHGLMLNCPNPPPAWQPFTALQEAAVAFSEYFVPYYDELALVSYSNNGRRDLSLSNDFGADSAFETAVMGLVPAGYTNIGHGLRCGRQELENNARDESVRVVILMSDGIANLYPSGGGSGSSNCSGGATGFTNCGGSGCAAARNYALNQAQALADQGVFIYTIGLGDTADEALLQQIADIGDGIYLFAPEGEDLEAAFQEIAERVRVRIVL